MYKSLKKSRQIIRSITMTNKIQKNDHYAVMLIFQKKYGRPGGGGSENSDKYGQGGGGKNGQKFADDLNGWRLRY